MMAHKRGRGFLPGAGGREPPRGREKPRERRAPERRPAAHACRPGARRLLGRAAEKEGAAGQAPRPAGHSRTELALPPGRGLPHDAARARGSRPHGHPGPSTGLGPGRGRTSARGGRCARGAGRQHVLAVTAQRRAPRSARCAARPRFRGRAVRTFLTSPRSLRQFRPHSSGSVAGLGSGQREGKRSDCRGKAPPSRPQPRSALAGGRRPLATPSPRHPSQCWPLAGHRPTPTAASSGRGGASRRLRPC